MEELETDIFQVGKASIVKTMVYLYGHRWLAISSALLLLSLLAGILIDIRWVIVFLILFLIILPMGLALLYFHYGFSRISVMNVIPHNFKFESDKITAFLYRKHTDTETNKTTYSLLSYSRIPYPEITDYTVGVSEVILRISNSEKGFLIIPVKVFKEYSGLGEAMNLISKGIRIGQKTESNNENT